MKYRADIDGLRALAVIPVVLFHANFMIFGGGYVGVDIFFVISGYLITKIIADEVREGRFSIINFYERRVRRIFPALFTVFLFTTLAGGFLLLPGDLEKLGDSLIAAVFFVSNLYFWKQSGYFDDSGNIKPLLHIWSLAVEEQFYVFFPLFLILAWRFGGHWKILTWLGLIGSLAISIYGVRYYNNPTFFLLPTRAWELLCGSVIALGAVPALKYQPVKEGLAALGLGLILAAIFLYDSSTLFPGETALLPCVGASLIIYAGLNGGQTAVSRLLSHRIPVFIGLISYSLYLWHWPLIAYAKYYNIAPLSAWQSLAVVGAAFLMAYLSWKFVERPFRWKDGVFARRPQLFSAALAVMLVTFGTGALFHAAKGFPESVSLEILKLAVAGDHDESCTEEYVYGVKGTCLLGPKGEKPDTLVWGDSHAGALVPGFRQAANDSKKPILLSTLGGCPGLVGVSQSGFIPLAGCPAHNDEVMNLILHNNIKHVILVSRWQRYLFNDPTHEPNNHHPSQYITDADSSEKSLGENKRVLVRGLERTVSALKSKGITVTIVTPIPQSYINVPSGLARAKKFGRFEQFNVGMRREDFDRTNQFVMSALQEQVKKNAVRLVDLTDNFCDAEQCRLLDDGNPIYFDANHISIYQAEKLSPVLEKIISARN